MTTPVSQRRSPRLALPQYNRSNSAIFVWNDAVYEMLADVMEAPKKWVSKSFMEERSKPDYVNPHEYYVGVAHPETGETITIYKKLMQIPVLKHIW